MIRSAQLVHRFARCSANTTFLKAVPYRIQATFPSKRTFASDSKPESCGRASPAAESRVNSVSNALKDVADSDNNLLAPVYIPEDPNGIIKERHPAFSILSNSAVVVQREIEMMNIMIGFEQANKYVMHDAKGNHIGFIAEQDLGFGSSMGRQFFHTHRAFTAHVFDRDMKEVLRFHRPFSWISSRIKVYDPIEVSQSSLSSSTSLQQVEGGALSPHLSGMSPNVSNLSLDQMRIIGEAQQQWAPLRRKYNLFLLRDPPSNGELPSPSSGSLALQKQPDNQEAGKSFEQFAFVDERFLSWDFSLLDADSKLLGSVNRNFTNFGREIFTDTGCYALRMDSAGLAEEPSHYISKTGQKPTPYHDNKSGMSLDQRAVMLATAVSVDFDYFSRQRSGMFGGMFPFWMGGGGEAAGGAAAGEAAGAAGAGGAMEGAAGTGAGAVGRAAGASGAGEGAMAGAGTMAGYEAMQRGAYGQQQGGDDVSPTAGGYDPAEQQQQQQSPTQAGEQGSQEEVWGEQSPWGDKGSGGDGGDGGDGGGGGWSSIMDFFDGDE